MSLFACGADCATSVGRACRPRLNMHTPSHPGFAFQTGIFCFRELAFLFLPFRLSVTGSQPKKWFNLPRLRIEVLAGQYSNGPLPYRAASGSATAETALSISLRSLLLLRGPRPAK